MGREGGGGGTRWKKDTAVDIRTPSIYRCGARIAHITAASINVTKTERGKSAYLISERGEAKRSEEKPPFDVNLKPRHKHVSRVAAPVGAEGRKRGRRV